MPYVRLLLLVLLAPPAAAQVWTLPPPEGAATAFFGAALALDRDRALVGAPGDDACGTDAGAAFVYERSSGDTGRFDPVARLEAAGCEEGRFLGRAVALDGDRALLAAGGTVIRPDRPNTAHLFERQPDGSWRERAVFAGESMSPFATSVALSGDRALVTAAGQPAHLYEPDASGAWRLVARLAPEGGAIAGFGATGALDGDRAVVSAAPPDERGRGRVFVFERGADGAWAETARLTDIRSHAMSLALDGPLLLVGHDAAGPGRSGEAVLYGHRPDGSWQRLATLVPDVPQRDGAFGRSVALHRAAGGPRAAVVGYVEQLGRDENVDRVVQVFRYDATEGWIRHQVLDVGTWAFGAAVALQDRTVLVGSTAEGRSGEVFSVRLIDPLP